MTENEEVLAAIHHGMSLIGQVDYNDLTPTDKDRFRFLLELGRWQQNKIDPKFEYEKVPYDGPPVTRAQVTQLSDWFKYAT